MYMVWYRNRGMISDQYNFVRKKKITDRELQCLGMTFSALMSSQQELPYRNVFFFFFFYSQGSLIRKPFLCTILYLNK